MSFSNGLATTKSNPNLSLLAPGNVGQNSIRDNLDDISYGTLGQTRSYTISYPIKESVTQKDLAKALNDYIVANNEMLTIDSWLEGYDKDLSDPKVRMLQNSYTNSFIDTTDSDKDGIMDFVELKLGSMQFDPDTDKDGVPDGQEYFEDDTDLFDIKKYIPGKPTTEVESINPRVDAAIKGTAPKIIYDNPESKTDPKEKLEARDGSGDVIVRLQYYIEDTKTYDPFSNYGEIKIPYADLIDGNFEIKVPANKIPSTVKKVVLVAYPPNDNQKFAVMGDIINVGASLIFHSGNMDAENKEITQTQAIPNNASIITLDTVDTSSTGNFYQEDKDFWGWTTTKGKTTPDILKEDAVLESEKYFINGSKNINLEKLGTPDAAGNYNLYAVYAPKISITAIKTWSPAENPPSPLYVALLARSADGIPGSEVMDHALDFNCVKDSVKTVTDYSQEIKWEGLPYVDANGVRLTYVLSEGMSEEIATKGGGTATINTVPQTVDGVKKSVRKDNLSVTNPDSTIDAYSMATIRKPTADVNSLPTGYNFELFENSLIEIDAPQISPIFEQDKEIKIRLPEALGTTNLDNVKIWLEGEGSTAPQGDADIILTKTPTGWQVTSQGYSIKGPGDDGLYTIGGFTGLTKNQEVFAQTFGKDAADQTIESSIDEEKVSPIVVTDNPNNPSFVKVEFLHGDHGSFEENVKTTFWVKKGASWGQVTGSEVDPRVAVPTVIDELGYEFTGWTENNNSVVLPLEDGAILDTDRIFTASYEAKERIKTENPNDPDYVSITYHSSDFVNGDDLDGQVLGKISKGQDGTKGDTIVYYVLKGTSKQQIVDAIGQGNYTIPTIHPDTGYKSNGWSVTLEYAVTIDEDLNLYVKYEKLADIVEDTSPDDESDKPVGYVTVKFLPGDHGVLEGTTKFYVNPNAGKTYANLTVPTISPSNAYVVDDQAWDPNFDDTTPITKDENHIAQYADALSATIEPIDPQVEKKEVTGNLKAVTPNKTGSTIRSTETNGLSVDENGNLVGTPTGLTWSSDPTAENYERQTVYIPVKVTNGEETYETNVPVLVYRDTDGDGKVDLDEGIKDPTTGEVIVEGDDDDDGDGYKDTVEKEAGTDPKDADSVPGSVIVPVGKVTVTPETQNVVEGKEITPVVIETPENSTITVDAPEGSGLTYDEATGKITGTPTVDDWGAEEETRVIKVPVTVETEGGATVTKTVEVTVYRDTDKDGKVDLDEGIKDPTTGEVIVEGVDDDDGDKITDTVEKEKGSDPKNPNSKPQTPIIVPGVVTITPGTQDVIEGEEITPVVIKTPEKSTVTVDTSKAPGLSYDEATGEITGTPEVNDWDDSQAPAYEEVRLIKTPLTVVDENGVTINKQIEITVQRDTDGDGNPDITDTDDDGDGFNDDLEKQMGTNPKDKDSKPTYTQVTDPSLPEKTEVANKDSLTDAEKTTVKEKLENANSFPEGTKVAIGNDGSATITYPDGSVDTIPGADLVVDKKPSPRPPRPSNPTPRPPVEEPQEPEKPKKKVDRINGDDRIGTSIELSQKYFDKAEIVVIARSDVYPDSLTASVLAKVLDAPIILTPSDQLDQRVAQELNRLETKMVYIVGGQTSITEGVQEDLVDITGSYKRLGGLDRFETSALVAREIVAKEGAKGIGVIASGETFPDALSISPYAAKEGYPILLVRKDNIPRVISQAMTDLGIEKTYVIGGENTISKNVENSLPGVLARIAGDNRYATSVEVAERFFKDADETAFIASGEIFADALVLGPVAAGEDAPILLVSRDNIPSEVDSYFKGHSFDKLTIVGGTNTISMGVENTLEEY